MSDEDICMSVSKLCGLKGTLKTDKTAAELDNEADPIEDRKTNETSSSISNLSILLKSLAPSCDGEKYHFATVEQSAIFQLTGYMQYIDGVFREGVDEGITIVFYEALRSTIEKTTNRPIIGPFAKITLTVHSDLNAVGLTVAVSAALAKEKISTNVVAAYYHDHVFVPYERRQDAMKALMRLSGSK